MDWRKQIGTTVIEQNEPILILNIINENSLAKAIDENMPIYTAIKPLTDGEERKHQPSKKHTHRLGQQLINKYIGELPTNTPSERDTLLPEHMTNFRIIKVAIDKTVLEATKNKKISKRTHILSPTEEQSVENAYEELEHHKKHLRYPTFQNVLEEITSYGKILAAAGFE